MPAGDTSDELERAQSRLLLKRLGCAVAFVVGSFVLIMFVLIFRGLRTIW